MEEERKQQAALPRKMASTDDPAVKRRRIGPAKACSGSNRVEVIDVDGDASMTALAATQGSNTKSDFELVTADAKSSGTSIKSEHTPGVSGAPATSQAGGASPSTYDAILADRKSSTKEQEDELKDASDAIAEAFRSYSTSTTDEPTRVLKNDLARVLSSDGAGKTALGKVNKMREEEPSIESVKTRRDPVCVAIFGGMGTGKSLLVNELCGVVGLSKSAKTEAQSHGGTTRVPVLIKYAKAPKLVARLAPKPLLFTPPSESGVVTHRDEPLEALERWAQEDASEDQIKREDVWTGNESELVGMHAALMAAVERNSSDEHELVFFELHWPAPGLKDLNIHVMDLPGHNELDTTQLLKCRIIRALHHAEVVLTTDTSNRGVIGKELFSSLNEHGWLHHRHILPAVGVVQNLKTLQIAGWHDNSDQFRADWAAQVRNALDEEFEDIVELPHRDAKNIAWLKSGIRVEVLPDYTQDAALAFKGSVLYHCVDELCRDFRTRNERHKALVGVRKLYQELYAVENSLLTKRNNNKDKKGVAFKMNSYPRIIDQIKSFVDKEKAVLARVRDDPATPLAAEPWASSRGPLRALVASETEEDKSQRTGQTQTAFGALLRCTEDYFESCKSQKDKPVFEFLQCVVRQDARTLGNGLITKHDSEKPWSDVVDALAKPITLWYEHAFSDLGARVGVSADTKSFWAAHLAKRVKDIRVGLGDYLRKESMVKLDENWRPLLDDGARPTLLRSERGQTLKLPTRAFETIAEAVNSREGVVAPTDEFVKSKFQAEGDGTLAQTRSRVAIVTNPTEDAPKPQIHDGIVRIDATLDCTDKTLEVSSTKDVLKMVAEHAERVVKDSVQFQNDENGATGPSLCPIVLFSDRQPRARDYDFKPRLHIHDLVDFVNKRRGQDGNGPVGSFILFVVHEEYEVLEDRSSEDESTDYCASINGSSQNNMNSDDTLAKMRKSFKDELDELEKSGLPGIGDESATWRVVEIVVERRDGSSDHGGAAILNDDPKLGIGRLRSVAQLLMEKWLRTPLYYQLDDDIQCEEFLRHACMFRRGSCTTGRALAFLHTCMLLENQPNDDNLAERISMLKDFKNLLCDLRDALGKGKKEKKCKKAVNCILKTFLEQKADLEKVARNEDELVTALSQFDGTDFGKGVGERARRIADSDDEEDDEDEEMDNANADDGAKAIFGKMEQRLGKEVRWWEGCDTFGALLAEILGAKRCAHVALSNLAKKGMNEAYVNRSYDNEGAQMLHMKTDAYPTHRVGLERRQVMLFNTSALRQILFVDDDALFAQPMDATELERKLKESRKKGGKWRREGRELARCGYEFSDSYFTRRLLGHGLGGIQVFKYAFRVVASGW